MSSTGWQRGLNKAVMLLFAGSLALISVSLMQLTNWPIGYLTLGMVLGFFADSIRAAIAGRLMRFANDEQQYQSYYPEQYQARGTHPIVGNPHLPTLSRRNHHLSLLEEQQLLEQTESPVENGTCIHCGFSNPLLDLYPYDPRLHYTDCMVSELRSLVDQIVICPQELIDSQCAENQYHHYR